MMSFLQNNKEAQYCEVEAEDCTDAGYQQRTNGRSSQSWYLAACVIFTLACSSASFLAGRHVGSEGVHHHQSKSPVPYIPQLSVTFEPDSRYAGPSSPESDVSWSTLAPPGDGFVVVPNPSKFGLQPGKKTEKGELYDVSVFHQLHCLTKIREHVSLLRYALDHNGTAGFEKIINPQDDHMGHCFDYLRQSTMCAGDLTIEWPKEEADGKRLVVDGWGIAHQCKNWDAILKYVKSNSFS